MLVLLVHDPFTLIRENHYGIRLVNIENYFSFALDHCIPRLDFISE